MNYQTDMSTLVTARQKLESQQQENKGVQKVCDQIFSEKHTHVKITVLTT
jgi:chaperonin cofactor prefoldin